MKCLILYSSLTGNTEKVAKSIENTLIEEEIEVDLNKITQETDIDIYKYDLIFLGSPSIMWLPSKATINFAERILKRFKPIPSVPICPGKYAVCFCTYGGPHTGISEAEPITKWMRAFFGHLGFIVIDEWFTPGKFSSSTDNNILGRLGDIKGRPNKFDLLEIEEKTRGIMRALKLHNL